VSDLTDDKIRRLRQPAHKLTAPGRRLRANWPAELRCDRARIRCHVMDISIGGAKVVLSQPLPPDVTKVWLIVDSLGPIAAEPVWRLDHSLGLRFCQDHPVVARLQSNRFDAAAWLEMPSPQTDPAS
jgi:hypothetical protein